MYSPHLSTLPGSENVGIIEGFMFDEDSEFVDEYYVEDLIMDEEEKLICNFLGPLPVVNWAAPEEEKAAQRKLQSLYWDKKSKLLKIHKFHNKAVTLVERRKVAELTKYTALIQKKINKSKHSVFLATTNETSQLGIEQILTKLGFKVKLRFTNPNHDRIDDLNLWILEK